MSSKAKELKRKKQPVILIIVLFTMEFSEIVFTSAENILEIYFRNLEKEDIFVIVIGANNGDLKDFLCPYLTLPNVKGILVEPIKYLFKELQEKYTNNDSFHLENSAIYSSNRKKKMFRLNRSDDFPDWINGLGSFNRENLILHEIDIPKINSQVVKEFVNCITFNALMKKYAVENINILQIDTEGYDYDIIKLIDFNRYRPDIILLEYLHLTYYQYFAAINLLRSNKYKVYRNKGSLDLIAIDDEIL